MFALLADARAQTPNVLWASDVENYKKIFDLQSRGRLKDADKLIKNIKNDLLMGYVLHQRFMGPHHKTSYEEARAWMAKYYDHPFANDIYKLGLQRGARKGLKVPMREGNRVSYLRREPSTNAMIQGNYGHLNKAARGDVSYMRRIFQRRLNQRQPDKAREVLENPSAKRFFTKNDYLRMQAYLGYSYFLSGNEDMATLWAYRAAEELDFYLANWTLGLSYWRMGEWEKSRDAFKSVAFSRGITPDMVSAGAYWAWRANERIPHRSLRDDPAILLSRAAEFPKTFYGILANYQEGKRLRIKWEEPDFTIEHAREISSWRGGMRALALIQLGRKNDAATELRFMARSDEGRDSAELLNAMMAIAQITNMPGLLMNLAQYDERFHHDHVFATPMYPMVAIPPAKGPSIDKALVNAITRQESRFNPVAKSHAGARGLMQVMPATASYITRDPKLSRAQRERLFEEELNLEIGQMYIDYLFSMPEIAGNLFKMLVAYNAGPGNLRRQLNNIKNPDNDPLLFIESVSIKETRIYIKRVMSNFWIYRHKLGKECESLSQVARGEWPMYSLKVYEVRPGLDFILPDFLAQEEAEESDDELDEAAIDGGGEL